MVVLAFEPFTVIHVNRAYTKMTGVAPSDILGKPFRHALDKGELSDLLLSTGECKSLMDINGRVLRTKATKQLQCQMNVSKLSTEYYSVAG
jgi:PAS domain-containing protein